VGTVVQLSDYRKKVTTQPENGFSVEIAPPVLIVRHFHNGVLTKEERVISESMLRDLLDLAN
jgi:hypothetical protein